MSMSIYSVKIFELAFSRVFVFHGEKQQNLDETVRESGGFQKLTALFSMKG